MTLYVVFSNFGWNSFTIPWGWTPKEFRAVGVESQDRESLFYDDCVKLLWASASGCCERGSSKSWKDII